jgi:hypothetical protein
MFVTQQGALHFTCFSNAIALILINAALRG